MFFATDEVSESHDLWQKLPTPSSTFFIANIIFIFLYCSTVLNDVIIALSVSINLLVVIILNILRIQIMYFIYYI